MTKTSFGARTRARVCGICLFALGAALCSVVRTNAQGSGIRAWGYDADGELGTSAVSEDRTMPSRVKASPGGDALSNVVQIAAGGNHTLVLKADGTVWAWGSNNCGQLGNGTTTGSLWPVQVMLSAGVPMTNVTCIAAGNASSYAVVNRAVLAWGDNSYSQLGNTPLGRTNSPVTYPVQASLPVISFLGTVQVVAGYDHALALVTVTSQLGINRTLYAWGDNEDGQLGQGSSGVGSTIATPCQVTLSGTSPVYVAAGGSHTLAVDASGNVWAWGDNGLSECGPAVANQAVPHQVAGISNAIQVAAGYTSSYALTQASGVRVAFAWGDNVYGQLGLGNVSTLGTANQSVATPTEMLIGSGATIAAVVAGGYSIYELMSDGTIIAAGDNSYAQLGGGDYGTPVGANTGTFQPVQNVTGATAMSCSRWSCFALTNDFKFVWQDMVTGITPYWDFGSTSGISNTYQGFFAAFLYPDYRIVTALDLFDDGNRHLLVQSRTTGALGYICLHGASIVNAGMIPAAPSYSPSEVVVGTMNINNSLAIVWQNTTTGEVDYWTMGLSAAGCPVSTGGGKIVAPGSYTWQVAAAYSAGGENWIIWHDISNDSTAGELVYQPVSTTGSYLAGGGRVYPNTVPAGWSLRVEDVNGDGNPDFIWHDNNGSSDPASGETYIWLMNGPAPTFKSSVGISGLYSNQTSIPAEYYIGAIL
jgi:alpha-tubulin suppressor-like RCC1 family protein